jgi:hypothetical protein
MYCNHCGTAIAADQLVCTNCGRSQLDARTSIVTRSRVGEHLHLLSILWFVVGGFMLICAGGLWALAALARVTTGGNPMTHTAGPIFFGALSMFCLVIALVNLITGWGLLRVRPWGRMLALVMAFIALLHPPFGTALGIYTLYVLLPSDAGLEYDRISASAETSAATA